MPMLSSAALTLARLLVNLRFTIKFCFTKLAACHFSLACFLHRICQFTFLCDFCTNCFLQDGFLAFVRLGSKVWWRLGKSEMDKALCGGRIFSTSLLVHISCDFCTSLFFTGWISCFRSAGSKVWWRLGKREMDKALCGGRIFSTSLLVHISLRFLYKLLFTGWISCFRSAGK